MKLRDALDLFLAVGRAPSTTATYRRFLSQFTAAIGPERPLQDVNMIDVAHYITEMSERQVKYATHPRRPAENEPLSRATVYKNKKMLKTFFNWCVQEGLVTSSPVVAIRNHRPDILTGEGKAATHDEVVAILEVARFNVRDHAIARLLSVAGPRAHEIAGMRLADLSLESHSAVINGKGSKRRRIYFDEETTEALQVWLEARPPDVRHNYVFTSVRGHGPLQPDSISEITERLSAKAGLSRRLGAHSFRHYVGTELARLGTPLNTIQAILGHSSSRITADYYQNVGESDIRLAVRRLNATRAEEKEKHPKIVLVPFERLTG